VVRLLRQEKRIVNQDVKEAGRRQAAGLFLYLDFIKGAAGAAPFRVRDRSINLFFRDGDVENNRRFDRLAGHSIRAVRDPLLQRRIFLTVIHPLPLLYRTGYSWVDCSGYWRTCRTDKELAAIGIRPAIRHGYNTRIIFMFHRQLIIKLVTRTAGAISFRITGLNHEGLNDAVKLDPVEIVLAGQENKIIDCQRRLGSEQFRS